MTAQNDKKQLSGQRSIMTVAGWPCAANMSLTGSRISYYGMCDISRLQIRGLYPAYQSKSSASGTEGQHYLLRTERWRSKKWKQLPLHSKVPAPVPITVGIRNWQWWSARWYVKRFNFSQEA